MFTESTDLYDRVYCRMKDYAAEARTITELIAKARPGACTVLDVACGTGEHARHLTVDHGLAVDGIDLDPKFVEIAAAKNPHGRFVCADMRAFELGRTYDAVTCMFSSIGYAATLEGVTAALRCFRAHLGQGGAMIVEPWFEPGKFRDGHVSMHTLDTDDLKVCRMSQSKVVSRMSHVHFEYLIGRDSSVTRATEDHALGLFTVDEMRACFREAGLTCEHDPKGLMNRGLYVARVAS